MQCVLYVMYVLYILYMGVVSTSFVSLRNNAVNLKRLWDVQLTAARELLEVTALVQGAPEPGFPGGRIQFIYSPLAILALKQAQAWSKKPDFINEPLA